MKLSLFENGEFPTCPIHFNMARHTIGHSVDATKTALEVISHPGKVAENWTYAALQQAILTTAGGLQNMGIGKSDRVALFMGNSSYFPILFFATNAIGAIPVPLSTMLTDKELSDILTNLSPKLVCTDKPITWHTGAQLTGAAIKALRDSAPAEFADTLADDPAYIVYTSGTGGTPKAVVHAQRAAWARRMMWRDWYGLQSNDRVMHAGAFNWTYTLGAGLTDPWANGATSLIYTGEKSRGVWAELAAQHHPTLFAAAPGVYRQILSSDHDLSGKFVSLRHAISAGEKLPDSVMQGWNTRIAKPIYEALGMSEISTYISHGPNVTPRTGTAGLPQKGRKVAVLDANQHPVPIGEPGFLAVHRSDPGLFKNYLHHPAPTDEWFVTGDRVSMDTDGYITHLGRADDILNAGGYRVSSQEIAQTLLTLAGITDCAVLDLLVKQDTSVITAFYTGDQLSEIILKTHCQNTLAAYKCPRQFIHLDTLPRSENGKLLRAKLVQKYGWKDQHDNA
ncbi:MAG: acyl--CoA ligase [Rhodobacteraceae bacterium]|nr:acyl--CoA ligase [Paracoccaceae bacterium]